MDDYAGEVVIGTDIEESGIDKGISAIEAKLEKLRKKAEEPYEVDGVVIQGGRNLTEDEEKYYQRLERTLEKLQEQKLQELQLNGEISESINTQGKDAGEVLRVYDETTKRVQELSGEFDNLYKRYKEIQKSDVISEGDLAEAKELEERITKIRKELEEMMGEKIYIKGINDLPKETEKTKKNINDIGKGINKVIRNVVKWGLAVFSVRSAYMFIRQSVSTLSQYNKQLATDLQYLRFAVATILEKTILKLVNWVFRLLQYINYLTMSWFKINLFANASADRMNDMVSSAKEFNKQVAPFDEMNIISDNSSGGGGGVETPSIDLSKPLEDADLPGWLKKIKKFGDEVIKNWKAIAIAIGLVGVALIGLKIAKWISDAGKAKEATEGLGTSFTGFFDKLGTAVEVIAILGGLALVISSLTELITAFSESGMTLTDVIGLMGTVLGTIVILMGAIALLGPSMTAGLIPFLGVVAGISAILAVMALTLPTILDAVGSFITTIAPSLIQLLDVIGINIDRIITSLGTNLPPIINSIGGLFGTVFNGIAKVISTVGNTIVKVLNTAKDLVTTVLNAILNFINRLGPAINNFVDNVIRAVTKLINFMISGIEYLVNTLVIRAVNKMIEAINKIGEYVGIEIPTVSQVSIPRFVPKFAKGTILNAPGKGVPVGGYQGLAGEAGREAYLPLSDRQLLEELGSTIGRYVNINATIPVQIGNRLVMREIKRIKAEDDFAYNS